MSSFSEKSSISSSISVPSLVDCDEEVENQKATSKSEENNKKNILKQSVPKIENTSSMDYRTLLHLKRNSTRKAWQISDSEDSDETNSDLENERTPADTKKIDASNEADFTASNGDTASNINQLESAQDSDSMKNNSDSENQILLKISVPEQTLTKCLRVDPTDTVWMTKQKITQSLSKRLPDVLNYGLFCTHQRAFLIENKLISDYVKSTSSANYELRYKTRIYSHIVRPGGDLRQLTKMQGESKKKELMRYVRQHNIDKISKLLAKGLDPNFQFSPSGETPLTSVITNFTPGVSESMSFANISLPVIRVLILGGAHIDFRNQQGFTPLHVAVRNGNAQAVKTLLGLGAPPDSFDQQDLTPLYHCSLSNSSVHCIRPLYEAGANFQCVNSQKWTILHQVCRRGRLAHLHVILDIVASNKSAQALLNMQNESGNTALHVCALYSYQQCLLTLLKNGIDKSVRNYAHQDAFQVAVVARNMNIANLIQDFSGLTEQELALLMQQNENDKNQTTTDKNIVRRHTISAASNNKASRPSHKLLFSQNNSESFTVRHKDAVSPTRPDITSLTALTPTAAMGQSQSYPLQDKQGGVGTTESFNSVVPEYNQNAISTQFDTKNSNSTDFKSGAPESISQIQNTSQSSFGAGSNPTSSMLNEAGEVNLQSTSHPDVFHYYRDVTLSKGEDGYGFILRGAKADKSTENFSATARHPGQQYLESVEPGSNADVVGLRSGDFILKINAIDVTSMGHRQAVDVIRKLRDPIRMRVVSVILKSSDTDDPNNLALTSLDMTSSASSRSKSPDGDLHRTESIGSAIGKLDSVLEDAFEEDTNEVTATLRRRPISRRFRPQDIEEIFRYDSPTSKEQGQRNRDSKLSTNGSVSTRLVRVLPPTIPSSSSPSSALEGKVSPSSVHSPTAAFDRYNSTESSTNNHYTMPRSAARPVSMAVVENRKAPPLPPERRDSRLTSTDANSISRQRSASLANQPTAVQSLGRSFGAPPPDRADLSPFASVIAARAQQRRERASVHENSEKVSSTPITHNLMSKATPSVAKKPDRGKPFSPLPKVPDSSEEPKSAFAIALAAKQANMRSRSQTTSVLNIHNSASQTTTVPDNRTQFPPPPSVSANETGNPILYNLPPPPPPVSHPDQFSNFDPTSLPPPPDTMLSSKNTNRNVSASSNGIDNGSSADSGVDEFTSHHRHQDSKANVDTLSVVSSLSTISSEDGSDAGVSLSYDPKNTSNDQNVGNMYLDVLRKNKTQPQPSGTSVQLTKVSFGGSKTGATKTTVAPQPAPQKHEPIKTAPVKVTAPSVGTTPSSDKATDKPLAEWNTDDVCKWLNGLGLSSYTQVFAENEIDGSHLPDLSKEDLQELGVTRVGHRLTIERSLKKLVSK